MKKKLARREALKLFYLLSGKGKIQGADLTDEPNVKRPTVCVYLKRLVKTGDITMEQHHFYLTEQDHEHSMPFALPQNLGVPSKITTEDACAIEHGISPEPTVH